MGNESAYIARASEFDRAFDDDWHSPQSSQNEFEFVPAGQMLTPKPVHFLIDELIETECLAMLFGASGSGKSFLAIAWACSVATGTPWLDRDVEQGSVFYLAGEGHAGLSRRLAAWQSHSGVNLETAPLFVSKMPAQLMDLRSAMAVGTAVERLSTEYGKPALIVVDTFARNMGSGDENSNADMAIFVTNIDQMRARLGCVVLLVHHTGHMEADRARGASALPAAIDANFRMDSKVGGITLANPKAKESEVAKPIALVLKQLQLPDEWIDAKGRVMTSAVLVSGVVSIATTEEALSQTENDAICAFHRAAPEHGLLDADGNFAGLHIEAWRTEVYRTSTADNAETKKKAFQRVRVKLVKLGQLTVADDIYHLSGIRRVLEAGFATALREKRAKTVNPEDHRDTGHDRDIDGTCPDVASP